MSPLKFRVKTWHKAFQVMFFVAVAYLAFSIIPPLVITGIYIGCYLVIFSGGFLLYTRKLIKQGKGDELRPK